MKGERNGSASVPTRHGASDKWACSVKPATRKRNEKAVDISNHFLSEKFTIGDIFNNYDDALCAHLTALRRSGNGRRLGKLASAGLEYFLTRQPPPEIRQVHQGLGSTGTVESVAVHTRSRRNHFNRRFPAPWLDTRGRLDLDLFCLFATDLRRRANHLPGCRAARLFTTCRSGGLMLSRDRLLQAAENSANCGQL